jgi:UDPglucose 6-dehydrogenase
VQVHDPEAMENVRAQYGDKLTYAEQPFDALNGADALAIATEWKQFLHPDFEEMGRRIKDRVIFDGRNLYNPSQMKSAGFKYYCIGRSPV